MSEWLIVFSGMLAALVADRAFAVVTAWVAMWRFKRMLTRNTQPEGWLSDAKLDEGLAAAKSLKRKPWAN